MKIFGIIFTFIIFSSCHNDYQVINQLKASIISQKQIEIIYHNTQCFSNNTQFSFAIIKNGMISYYGTKRENDTIKYINNYKNIFEIGSITKVFTSTLLADFVIKKQLKLNEPIQPYLTIDLHEKTSISFLQLANHTAGLSKSPTNLTNQFFTFFSTPYQDYNQDKLNYYLENELMLNNLPGKNYEYSNLGMGLLGYLLSLKQDSTYEQLLESHILRKYQMTNTTSNLLKIKNNLITGLDKYGQKTKNWNLNSLVAAGGIFSNVEDLSTFSLAHFDDKNKELKLARKETFSINDSTKIALGWHINQDKWIWHNGGTGGYSSIIILDTKKKNGVIILSNVSAYHENRNNVDQLSYDLMKTLE